MGYNNLLIASYDGARIINASWAGGCFFSSYHQQVIDEIIENGGIIIAAAGNGETCGGSSNLVYPASYKGVISVTSIGPDNNHERIPGNTLSTHQHNEFVDISAPGYDVPVALRNNQYGTSSGTSFAAPFVSGTVGLMLATNPNLNQCEVEYILKSSSTNIDSINPYYMGKMGAGRLDAQKTLTNTVKFTPTQTTHNILYSYLNPIGDVVIESTSDLTVSATNYEFVTTIQDEYGNYYQEYQVEIIYETGCRTKMSYWISEDDFYTDSMLILPVDLIKFEAVYSNDTVLLNWDTMNESGIDSYEIYSSTDGKTWSFIASTEAYNRESQSFYQLIDTDFEYTTMYYQLNRIDINGVKSTIGIQSLQLTEFQKNEVTIYPNPVVDYMAIKAGKNISEITIYNSGGQKVSRFVETGSQVLINTIDLTAGVYYAHIIFEDGQLITEKIIIKG
jgi:hypothetical protein